MWVQQEDITETNASMGLLWLTACGPGEEAQLCIVSGAGTHLLGGALQLHSTAALVFDSSCAGVEVSDCTISGAHTAVVFPCASSFFRNLCASVKRHCQLQHSTA